MRNVSPSLRKQIAAFSLAWLAGLCAAGTAVALPPAPPPPPNLVVILLDNLGQEWLGCYGSEEGVTPRMDQLAAQGVRVEHCYAPPVCGPSRTVFLTGRYLLRSGFTLHHDAALYGGGGLDPRREVTFARLLQSAGYVTALAGKWQINNLYDEPDILTAHGFNEYLAWPGSVDRKQVDDATWARFQQAIAENDADTTTQIIQNIESRYWNPVFIRNGRRETQSAEFGPDVAQRFAIDFIRRHRQEPFLLYYPIVLTHGQTFTQPVVRTPGSPLEERPEHEMFADMVRYADKLVGDLVEELNQTGLRERTIVFIATDNGTESRMSARARGRTVQGGLYQLTEAGGDVALIVNAPTMIPGGRTIPLADFSDILPTLCDIAGAPRPRVRTIDGRSFADQLVDPEAPPHRSWIFNQYHDRRVVRDRRYKLYSTGELFDVSRDFDEQHNLAKKPSPEAAAARDRLQAALDSLPANAPPPFPLRSQSAFRLRSAGKL